MWLGVAGWKCLDDRCFHGESLGYEPESQNSSLTLVDSLVLLIKSNVSENSLPGCSCFAFS